MHFVHINTLGLVLKLHKKAAKKIPVSPSFIKVNISNFLLLLQNGAKWLLNFIPVPRVS